MIYYEMFRGYYKDYMDFIRDFTKEFEPRLPLLY